MQVLSVVGLLQDETDPMVSVMKVRSQPSLCHPAECFYLRGRAHLYAVCVTFQQSIWLTAVLLGR